jgi:RNA polymerase sigma-70 factor, ECF subfamily
MLAHSLYRSVLRLMRFKPGKKSGHPARQAVILFAMEHNTNQADLLYREYSARIRNYLSRFVGKTDAEDLCQEIFMKVNANIGAFKGESSVKTWIYRIAANRVTDFFRSKAYRQSTRETPISEAELEAGEILRKTESSIDETLDEKKMNGCIASFIRRLPVNYASILVLSEFGDLSGKEIAAIAGISAGTVKVRLSRARARLKKELASGCTISATGDDRIICERKRESCG